MIEFTSKIGLIINCEKSEIEPIQDLTYIGARSMTRMGMVKIPGDCVEAVKTIASAISKAIRVIVRQYLRFLGLLNSCIFQIEWRRLHTRPLQLYIQAWWKPSTGHIEETIPILPSAKEHIQWWEKEENLWKGE